MILPICISLVKQLVKLDPNLNKRSKEQIKMSVVKTKSNDDAV